MEIVRNIVAFVAANPLETVSYIITAGSALAAFTPSAKDDGFWAKCRSAFNLFGLNFLNAKNAKK